jgi:hypothetical protein
MYKRRAARILVVRNGKMKTILTLVVDGAGIVMAGLLRQSSNQNPRYRYKLKELTLA